MSTTGTMGETEEGASQRRSYTFILERFDDTNDRIDTADPEAAAFMVRVWEREPSTLFITMRLSGGHSTLIYGKGDDIAFLRSPEHLHGAPVVCHNDWCPFYPDPGFNDICRKCPGGRSTA